MKVLYHFTLGKISLMFVTEGKQARKVSQHLTKLFGSTNMPKGLIKAIADTTLQESTLTHLIGWDTPAGLHASLAAGIVGELE